MYGIDFIFVLDAIGVIGARILPQKLGADDGDGDALEAPGRGQGLGPVAAIEVAARGTDVAALGAGAIGTAIAGSCAGGI